MRTLIYLATPTPAAAWTWINGHHQASASNARAAAAHRPRPIRTTHCCPAAAAFASSLHGGGGHNPEEQLLALGRRHAQAGDLESAVLQFERAASQAPRSAVCKVELGRALVRVGRPEDGFNCLVDAFGIDSLCPGVKDGFLEYYRAEIEADPSNIDLHEGLAALCVDSGRPEEAAACYRRCLELHAAQAAQAAQAATCIHTSSSSSSDVPIADLPSEVPRSPAVPPDATAAEAAEADQAAEARTDRWSVALFKCNASLCQWGDWDAEALALRTAVRRQRRRRRRDPGGESTGLDRGEVYAVGGGRGAVGPPLSCRQSSNHSGDLVELLLLGRDDDDGNVDDSWPSRDVKQDQSSGGGAGVDGGISSDFPRPALHPFDSLSPPLSIGDCLDVAQQQSRGLLAEAREEGACGNPEDGVEGQDMERNDRGEGRAWPPERTSAPPSSSPRDASGRLRLGYVSGDLMGTHPLTHLMQSTFGMHDRDRFEVFLYALNPDDGSKQRRRLEAEVEHFRDLSTLTATEAAAAIADDGVGILVNLGGYAGTAKSADIFVLRPAPVAVSYMGFPGTMGSVEMVDYILADRVVIPPDLRRFYSEKVLEMPNCYFVNDYRQSELAVIDSKPPERADHGLPPLPAPALAADDGNDGGAGVGHCTKPRFRALDEATSAMPRQRQRGGAATTGRGGALAGTVTGAGVGAGVDGCSPVVLCNFNRLHKIDPHTFGAWMEVLRAVPGAVLWLLDGGETARTNLRRQARLAGVEEGRVIFAPLVGKEEHLQRLRLADLFVDTPLYNAHTVGCDALWAGVPMVTLRGEKMASRVGASLVEAAGMPELVTGSLEEYTQLVLALTKDTTRRLSARQRLAGARITCPLFDTRRWVRDAEDLLRWAWERHEAGLPPAHCNSNRLAASAGQEAEDGRGGRGHVV